MKKISQYASLLLCGGILFGLAIWAWLKPSALYSQTERRSLAAFPKVRAEALLNGRFMQSFEEYSMDQFPMRDELRGLKAICSRNLMGIRDNHGFYSAEGYLSRLEYPLNREKVGLGVKKLNEIQANYLAGTECKIYLSVIPDKNYFLAPRAGYPMLDYVRMLEQIKDSCSYHTYIDVFDLLELSDYYNTDQHWRQERITDVAGRLLKTMTGCDASCSLEERILEFPFYGAYVGQAALPFPGDTIHYLISDKLEQCRVFSYNTGKPLPGKIYDLDKAAGRDPYEMFLSGADPLVVIENPNSSCDRELVVFRDSFASSLVPLLTEGYRKITLVDLRYIRSDLIGNYISFDHQDVLYLYSTLTLNNNISM